MSETENTEAATPAAEPVAEPAPEPAAPKKRGRSKKAPPAADAPAPPADNPDADLVDVPDEGDGPGWYLCIHKCIGKKEYSVGDRAYFESHPGRHYFVKAKDA